MKRSNQNKIFLQSVEWQKFQEAVGRKTYRIENDGFSASIVGHILPIVGKYFYVPRGPVFSCHSERNVAESKNLDSDSSTTVGMTKLLDLAKKENAGWIRIEPENEEILEFIKQNIKEKIVKAPHDMQPKENFVLDISKSPEQLLAEMKPKTRYNIGVAQKHGVSIQIISNGEKHTNEYIDVFLKLTKKMAIRQGIVAHPEEYYRKMIESFPSEMLKIYTAKYEGKIIAANLVLFYPHTKKNVNTNLDIDSNVSNIKNDDNNKNISVGVNGDTATYLHGASGDTNRNLMAPFSLQWKAILDAKEAGFKYYDFGGVKTKDTRCKMQGTNSWEGITNFKLGFSPKTKPVEFPGSYDIVINPRKYAIYRGLQKAKAFAVRFRK